jgi:hypothetical protein
VPWSDDEQLSAGQVQAGEQLHAGVMVIVIG